MVLNFLLGKRELLTQEEIVQFIRTALEFDIERERTDRAGILLIFQTLQQQTWLVATSERLYCVLDDIRRPKPEVRWIMAKSELVSDHDVIVHIATRRYSENSGRIDIANHTGWLYSKALFSTVSVDEAIKALIHTSMVGGSSSVRLDISSVTISGFGAKARPQQA